MGFMDDAEVQTRKFTRLEYDRLIEAEFFRPDDRIELIGGHMVVKEPQHSPHAAAIMRVQRVLSAAFGAEWSVRTQMALALDEESEPEPDVSVVRADPDDYEDGHPTSAALIVEVALSRLRFDRRHKSSLYARARIADYWIVNIPDRRLEVYRDPMPDSAATFGWRYGLAVTLGHEQHVTPLALPATSIAVAQLLGRLRTP
jgi:Uma2 family endonuclease